jgi:hypothetical protein
VSAISYEKPAPDTYFLRPILISIPFDRGHHQPLAKDREVACNIEPDAESCQSSFFADTLRVIALGVMSEIHVGEGEESFSPVRFNSV